MKICNPKKLHQSEVYRYIDMRVRGGNVHRVTATV